MELITDRTNADVLLGNEKGKYAYTDLNRVESAVEEIQEQYKNAGNLPLNLTTKTDWKLPEVFNVNDWPTASSMSRYLENIKKLAIALNVSTANLPTSMNKLTYSGANEIEKVLALANKRLLDAASIFSYSGELYTGEV